MDLNHFSFTYVNHLFTYNNFWTINNVADVHSVVVKNTVNVHLIMTPICKFNYSYLRFCISVMPLCIFHCVILKNDKELHEKNVTLLNKSTLVVLPQNLWRRQGVFQR